MNNPSVKMFTSLAGFLLALGLVSSIVISLSNHVRHQHYWTELVSPAMTFLSENQHRLNSAQISSLSVVSSEQGDIADLTRARLELGQVVFLSEGGLFRSYVRLDTGLLLELESDQSGRSIYELYLWVILGLTSESGALNDAIKSLTDAWGISVQLVDDASLLSSQAALDSLAEYGHHLVISNDQVFALMRAPSGEVYRLVFRAPFSYFSWPVAIVLALGVLAAIYGLVLLFVQTYERRLRNVETMAERIARGELDARVKNVNSGGDATERLSTAFNAMADHIQRLMLVQKEMIHAVSHELRTPVARIRFGVQMIEDCPDPAALRKQVQGIDSDIQELDELIDEILTYARLEQGGPILSFQDANLSDIIHQVVDEQSRGKPSLDLTAEFESSSDEWLETEVEPRYIHRSIQNLVGNATRYASSKVTVSCVCDKDTCRVDVEDDGPGIPEDQWESVFTPFARLDDSRTRSSGGYGLGLSIVRRILYWHGGQAFLGRSETLGGAKFSLVWPRNQRDTESYK